LSKEKLSKLKIKKNNLEKKILPDNFLQKQTPYNNAIETILKSIDPKKHSEEIKYIEDAFYWAYKHDHPWDTLTYDEKVTTCKATALLLCPVISLLIISTLYQQLYIF